MGGLGPGAGAGAGALLGALGKTINYGLGLLTAPVTAALLAGLTFLGDLIAFLLGVFINFFAFLLTLTLGLSQTLLTTPAIQTGFSICLALANLGFVIALLVIAVMTILQSETYGIKKLLPKLILAAVFVNFSLVIAGSTIKFSDGTAYYFAQQASPNTLSSNPLPAFTAFVGKFMGSLNPQGVYAPPSTDALTKSLQLSSQLDQGFAQLANLLFIVFFNLLVMLAFALATVMMLIRYVYLGILLITAPLAWLMWIFPSFTSLWNKWWQKFLRWTFFAPLMMVFLYIAMLASQARGGLNGAINAIATTSAGQGLLTQIMRESAFINTVGGGIIIIGIALGGIIAANSFGITLAGSAISGAKTVGNKTKGYLGRKSAQLATRPFASQMEQAAQMQRSTATGIRGVATRLTGRAIQAIGTRGQRAGEKRAQEAVAGLTSRQTIDGLPTTLSTDHQIARLERILNEGKLNQVQDVDRYLTNAMKAEFARRGKQDVFDRIKKESGSALREGLEAQRQAETHLATAQASRVAGGGTQADVDAAQRAVAEANEKIANAIKGVDVDKIAATLFPNLDKIKQEGGVLGIAPEQLHQMQRGFIKTIAAGGAENFSSAMRRVSIAGQLDAFNEQLKTVKGEMRMSDAVETWLETSSAARNLGIKVESFRPISPEAQVPPEATAGGMFKPKKGVEPSPASGPAAEAGMFGRGQVPASPDPGAGPTAPPAPNATTQGGAPSHVRPQP